MAQATVDRVRTLINDLEKTEIPDDTFIEAIIEIESEVYRATSSTCYAIASSYANKMEVAAGSTKVLLQQKWEHWMRSGAQFLSVAMGGGGGAFSALVPVVAGISKSEMAAVDANADRVDSKFKTGQHGFTEFEPQAKR